MSSQYSEELINAFVDGELDGNEKEEFRNAMSENQELSQRVNLLCELKQSVQLSYSAIPEPAKVNQLNGALGYKNLWQLSYAAVLFLVVGVFFGWISHGYIENDVVSSAATESINGIKLTPVAMQQSNKILLHISSSEPVKLKQTLSKIETILSQYNENKLPFELEIIANAGGIDLLRKDVSPYKDRIEEIMKTHNNVSFVACSNAINRLKSLGIKPDLIAETKSGVTAVERIVQRLGQGWVYVKV
ncbi:MAG: hypothetical protein OEY61_05030 [Gammaproteobacteria bacterium]|nr:hypothetical protein [Gammaproteobacteria bacterium]